MDVSFEGRTALVTGAASGLGQAVARLLVDSGARVVGYDLAPITADGSAAFHSRVGMIDCPVRRRSPAASTSAPSVYATV